MTGQLALPLLVATSNWAIVGLPVTAALAAVALMGYLFGQRTRTRLAELSDHSVRELDRAARIAWQLESIADTLRRDLLAHHAAVTTFKRRLRQARDHGQEKLWDTLCSEAEAMLGPTLQLAHQLAHAYDQIRQQSESLETFTEGRTDPLTGVGNARAFEQQLHVLIAGVARGTPEFAVALVSVGRDEKTDDVRGLKLVIPVLPKLAGVIRQCLRGDTDFVARFGEDEFVVLMPQTNLAGASVFSERLRKRVQVELGATICCGVAVAEKSDSPNSLLARADSALYSAKAAGPNRVFLHTGTHIREHHAGLFRPPADAEPRPTPSAEDVEVATNEPLLHHTH